MVLFGALKVLGKENVSTNYVADCSSHNRRSAKFRYYVIRVRMIYQHNGDLMHLWSEEVALLCDSITSSVIGLAGKMGSRIRT